MAQITNVAAYRFVQIDDLPAAREQLRSLCKSLGLKGTILLAHEGINLFVAGEDANIETFIEELQADQRFSDLEFKRSPSDHQPFRRMLVRIKQEIIAFGVDGIAPRERTSPKLSAQELKKWLDEGRPITLLDVRNEFEVELGTFNDAVPIGIDNFRDFPHAVEKLPDELKERPVVMFCTGGIRCEKAGPFMEREGFQQIFQLDGGILRYFEECGSEHYSGECFVFDRRVAVDASLSETETTQCFACQAPLTVEQQRSPLYVFGEHCPQCFMQPADAMSKLLSERRAKLLEAATPLPGSEPYLDYRPLNVPPGCDGLTVLDVLDHLHPQEGRAYWKLVCQEGRMHCDDAPIAADQTVHAGQRLEQALPGTIEPHVNAGIHFLYEDSAIIVIDKPAPLPMRPSGRFKRNTLSYLLEQVYHPLKPRGVHHLDADTSGLVVLTMTRGITPLVQSQFERGEVEQTYLARVHGHPELALPSHQPSATAVYLPESPASEGDSAPRQSVTLPASQKSPSSLDLQASTVPRYEVSENEGLDPFDGNASMARQPRQADGGAIGPAGLSAKTSFEVSAKLEDDTALVKVRTLTSQKDQTSQTDQTRQIDQTRQTDQIRRHLWHLGYPICGDTVYLPNGERGQKQTRDVNDDPLCLHALQIVLNHPKTGERIEFESTPPSWSVATS